MFGELRQLREPTPQSGGKWIYGAWVATSRLMSELLQSGVVETLDCFSTTARMRTEQLGGAQCREIPFTLFPLEAGRHRYETVFSYFGWNSGLPSLRAQFLPGSSHVQVAHSMHYERTLWDFGSALIWGLYEPQDAIVCTSPTAVRTLRSMIDYWKEQALALHGRSIEFPASIVEIPLATDLPAASSDRNEARARLGLDAHDVTILVLGRLSSFDKMDLGAVLAMFAQLARRGGKRLSFILAGEDSDNTAERLMRAARHVRLTDRLRIYTNIGSDLREDLYTAADIFLSLADHVQETFGLTILEAMAHGLPVVASDWGGYRDLVQPGRTGFLVRTLWGGRIDDLGAVASIDSMTSAYELSRRTAVDLMEAENALATLIGNESLRRSMGRVARKHVEATFTWPKVVTQYRVLWKRLASLRKSADAPRRRLLLPRGQRYGQLFSHYPTRRLGPHDEVLARATVAEAAQGNPVFVLSHEEERRALVEILKALGNERSTVADCLRRAAAEFGLPAERMEDYLMLAAKYGLVDIRAARNSRRKVTR